MHYSLLCPHKRLFSKYIQNKCNKLFYTKFLNISQIDFDKIYYKFNIILLRHQLKLKYKKNSNIKYIISPTTGLNHIDKKYFKDKKIKIISLKNELGILNKVNSTAEHTIYLLLKIIRDNFKSNKKNFFEKKYINITEINNKKVGIIGYGRLGKKVNKILKSFGAKTYIFDNSKKIKKTITLRKMLKLSDIITIHIPLNNLNKNFIDKKKFELLKNNCIIINTSRGEIIDQKNLIKYLKLKNLKYGTDVLQNENNLKKNNSSRRLIEIMKKNKSVYITPHVGGLSKESVETTDKFILNKFLKSYEKK